MKPLQTNSKNMNHQNGNYQAYFHLLCDELID